MNFAFHREARAEFEAAIEFYEECQSGLGWDFTIEVYEAVQSILAHPQAWPRLDGVVRRCLIRRFPFGILYSIQDSGIVILAVMHLRRRPDYWKPRSP